MKIICTQENLNQGLQIVSSIASKSVHLPILNNVYIKAEESIIVFSTTNLEVGVSCVVRGKVEDGGEITIQSKLLSDYVSFLPRENITLTLQGENSDELFIESKNQSTRIKGVPASDFPLIPKIEKKEPVVCKAADLRKALSQVLFAVSVNETRPEINGVYFEIVKDALTLAGTDSYRLAEKKMRIKQTSVGEHKIIVPTRTLHELVRILSSFKDPSQLEMVEDVEMYITENQIVFSLGSVDMVSRLIEGKFPGYGEIIPQKSSTKISIATDEMIKAVKGASLFSRSGVYDVNLEFFPDKGEVVISSSNTQLGQNITTIAAEVSGEKNRISVNYRFLLDGLQNVDSDEVIIELVTSTSPCVIKPKGQEGYLYIVMPIK